MDVAEAVGDVGLSVHVACRPGEFEGLLAVAERAEMVAEVCLPPADVVQRRRLARPVASGPVVLQAQVGVFQGESGVALRPRHPREVLVGPGLARVAADRDEEFECPQVVLPGGFRALQPVQGEA